LGREREIVMPSIYDIQINEQTDTSISFNVSKNKKLWLKTPIFSKRALLEIITEKELEQNSFIDLTLKDNEYRTVEQIMNNANKYKQCSNCGNISLKERLVCWNCKNREFDGVTDDKLGTKFKEINPSKEVRV
jgi:RNA polymerase-binding transcription factor DksA